MGILALDVATTTGWAFGDAGDKPQHGTFKLPATGEDLGRYGYLYVQWLVAKLRELGPKEIVFEETILPMPRFDNRAGMFTRATNILTLRKLYGLAFVTEVVATMEGVPCSQMPAAEWRRLFLGQHYPKKAKRDELKRAAVAVCRLHGWEPNSTDDADALGIWHVTTCMNNPKFAAEEAVAKMGRPAA